MHTVANSSKPNICNLRPCISSSLKHLTHQQHLHPFLPLPFPFCCSQRKVPKDQHFEQEAKAKQKDYYSYSFPRCPCPSLSLSLIQRPLRWKERPMGSSLLQFLIAIKRYSTCSIPFQNSDWFLFDSHILRTTAPFVRASMFMWMLSLV